MKLRSKTVRRPSKAATENRALNQRAAGRRHAPAPPVAGQGRRSQRGSREQPQEEQEEQQPSPPQPALPPPSQPAVDDEIAVALLQLALPTLQLEALDGLQQQQQQQPSAPDALPPPPAPTCDAEAARWLAANQLSPLLDLGVLRRGLASPDSAASCWPAAAGTPQLLGPAASLGSAARVQAPLLSFSAARLPAALYFGEPSGLREPGLGNPSATKRMRFDAVGRPPPASGAAEAAGLYALSAVPISPLQAKSTHQQPKPVCVEERSLFYAAASQVPFEIPAVAWGRPQSAAAAAVAAAAAAAAPSGSAPSMASWVLERGPTPLSHQSAATGYSPEAVSPEAGLSCDRSRRERRQRKVDASFDTWSDEDEEKQGGRGQEEEDYSCSSDSDSSDSNGSAGTHRIAPRRGGGQPASSSGSTKSLPKRKGAASRGLQQHVGQAALLRRIQALTHLSVSQAAAAMGCSYQDFRKLCRSVGIQRWITRRQSTGGSDSDDE